MQSNASQSSGPLNFSDSCGVKHTTIPKSEEQGCLIWMARTFSNQFFRWWLLARWFVSFVRMSLRWCVTLCVSSKCNKEPRKVRAEICLYSNLKARGWASCSGDCLWTLLSYKLNKKLFFFGLHLKFTINSKISQHSITCSILLSCWEWYILHEVVLPV